MNTKNHILYSLFLAGLLVLGSSAAVLAQDTTPLWANVPETISPEWGAFFTEKGQGRETPMPAPDDIEGWKAVQAANDEAKEAAADDKARGPLSSGSFSARARKELESLLFSVHMGIVILVRAEWSRE